MRGLVPVSKQNQLSKTQTEFIDNDTLSIFLSSTQMNKSTINANNKVCKFFRQNHFVNYDELSPGIKIIMPCITSNATSTNSGKGSFFIPKRRGESQPEPRFWIYNLNQIFDSGETIFLRINEGVLFGSNSMSNLTELINKSII
jgi:hypothetical protein